MIRRLCSVARALAALAACAFWARRRLGRVAPSSETRLKTFTYFTVYTTDSEAKAKSYSRYSQTFLSLIFAELEST